MTNSLSRTGVKLMAVNSCGKAVQAKSPVRQGAERVLCEQVGAGLGELHVGTGLLLPQPAFGDGIVQRGTVVLGRAAFLEQERPVDLLDVDAAVLHRLDRVGDLQQLAGGDGRISEGARRDVLHAATLSSLSGPRISITCRFQMLFAASGSSGPSLP